MDETTVFNVLLDLASTSKDPEGVVAACLVRADVILEASASSDDGHYHAEYLVIQRAAARGMTVDGDCVVYTTLEPCSNLPTVNDGVDCTTLILEAGLRHVVFAASDPEHSAAARVRFDQAGGTYRQVEDPSIIRRAVRTRPFFSAFAEKNHIVTVTGSARRGQVTRASVQREGESESTVEGAGETNAPPAGPSGMCAAPAARPGTSRDSVQAVVLPERRRRPVIAPRTQLGGPVACPSLTSMTHLPR